MDCKATVFNRQIDERNKPESPETDPRKHSLWSFGKEAKANRTDQRPSFQKVVLEQVAVNLHKMGLDTDLTTFTKMNSECSTPCH